MRKISKVLAPVLAALMIAAFMLPCFAADTDPYAMLKEGTGYVAIGDSFTRGYGAGTNWQNEIYLNDSYGNYNCRNVGGSYPNLVSEYFGFNTPDDIRDKDGKMWMLAHDAVSTAYMLDLLGIDDGYRDDEFTYKYSYMTERYETDLRYFGDPESLAPDGQSTYGQTGEIMSVRELINNASLITIGVGQTDVIYKAQIFGLNTLDMSDIAGLPAGIAHIVDLLWNYFDYWKDAYPLLLDYIKENNPDAKVVLVGTLNPLKDATLTDDIGIKIGSILNVIMDSMNSYAKACAMKRGYMFVDISDVDTPTSVNPKSIGYILSITDETEYALVAHPTANGYAQIADMVISAVNGELEKEAAISGMKNVTGVKEFFVAFFNLIKALFSNFFKMF